MIHLTQITLRHGFTANFLQYDNALRVVRFEMFFGMKNVIVGTAVLIKNDTDYEDNYFNNGTGSCLVKENGLQNSLEGNALGVDICANAGAFEETFSGNAGTNGVTTGTPAAGATVVGIDNGGGSAGAGKQSSMSVTLFISKKQTDKSMKLL